VSEKSDVQQKLELSELVSLCKRRGFIFQSSELYGGLNSCWDYGPLGVELKRRVKDIWWRDTVQFRNDVVGIDASILMHPRVWEASGHVESFHDPMVDCKECKGRFRADHLEGDKCPECGGELTEPRDFNLMFKTHVGAVADDASAVYLRPETAQAIFVDFEQVMTCSRLRIPCGIAQIGKSFRNEVTTRYFIFRSREFEQMELEFFVAPDDEERWFEYWLDQRLNWYTSSLGIKKGSLRLRPHEKTELAHYAKGCSDVEFLFPFGWSELEGIANRTNFDLSQHAKFSGKKIEYFDDLSGQKFVPSVIESSAGVDRTILTILMDAYDVEPERTVLRFHPDVAPIQVAVFPLMKKPELVEVATKLEKDLRKQFRTFYDVTGNIGRRYRRQDEIGTPYCVTIDYDSLNDHSATLRDRDSMKQKRVSFDQMIAAIGEAQSNPDFWSQSQ